MKMHGLLRLLPFLLLLPLWGCLETSQPYGDEVAFVNGQSITFREMETRRARLFSGLSAQVKTLDDEALRRQYLYVVNQIIEEMVICQYMEKKGFNLEPGEVEAEEERIRRDYPDGAFEQMLLEEDINLDTWRDELHRGLMVRKYINAILWPEVIPSPEEMLLYYNEHKAEFIIPEQWHFIQISGVDKKEVEAARDALLSSKDAETVQKRFMVTIHDIQTASEMLPEDFRRQLAKLTPWSKSPVSAHEKEFRTWILLEKIPQAPLDAASITARVERILSEDKLAQAYTQAVDKLVSKAKVRIADSLLYSAAERAEKNSPPARSGGNATLPDAPGGNATLPGAPDNNAVVPLKGEGAAASGGNTPPSGAAAE